MASQKDDFKSQSSDKKIAQLLVSWDTVSQLLGKLSAKEVHEALKQENRRENGPRPNVQHRLIQRYDSLTKSSRYEVLRKV